MLREASDFLYGLGLATGAVEAALEGLKKLGKFEDVIEFLAKINQSGIADFVKTMGTVFDVADVVVNMAMDFVEHSSLPMDERVLHSLTDAAIRFGVSEGAEHGVTVLMAAAGSFVPVLGTAVGAAVGKVVGFAISEAAKLGFKELDGHFDVVDKVADQVVDAYRGVKNTVEFVGDRVEDVREAAKNVVDGATDIAGEIQDAAGDFVDGLGGGVDKVGRWLGIGD